MRGRRVWRDSALTRQGGSCRSRGGALPSGLLFPQHSRDRTHPNDTEALLQHLCCSASGLPCDQSGRTRASSSAPRALSWPLLQH
eukprot:1136506-Pelagomonas_calceolata.AAC.2